MAIAERKLLTRNDRIQNLESLLHAADQKLTARNQKYEAQLAGMRERLAEGEQSSEWAWKNISDMQRKRNSRAGTSMDALRSRSEVGEDRVDMEVTRVPRLCINRLQEEGSWGACSRKRRVGPSDVSGLTA